MEPESEEWMIEADDELIDDFNLNADTFITKEHLVLAAKALGHSEEVAQAMVFNAKANLIQQYPRFHLFRVLRSGRLEELPTALKGAITKTIYVDECPVFHFCMDTVPPYNEYQINKIRISLAEHYPDDLQYAKLVIDFPNGKHLELRMYDLLKARQVDQLFEGYQKWFDEKVEWIKPQFAEIAEEIGEWLNDKYKIRPRQKGFIDWFITQRLSQFTISFNIQFDKNRKLVEGKTMVTYKVEDNSQHFTSSSIERILHEYCRWKAEQNQAISEELNVTEQISLPKEQPLEYLVTKEFSKSHVVEYYSELVKQRFGQTYKGVPFYSGLALAVIENSSLEVQQRLDDENDPHQFKFIDTVIDGNNYLNAYKEGFKAGIDFFEKEYSSTSSVIYGSYADAYAINLHKLYKHGPDNVGIGWEWEARGHNRFITDTAFRKYGYYAGLCYSIDCLAQKHPHLSDTIYTCSDEDNSKALNRKVIPSTLFDAWIEDLDNNGRKPYYDEVIRALVEHDRLKEIKGELYWITSDNYVSYCAGFIWTCIDKGWVKMYTAPKLRAIINNSFNTAISSTTTFKQDALFSLGAKYSNPFKSMRKNAN